MEEIEKIKRKKKVNDQDKQQPGSIQDLIRRYDLDNIKEADYFDYLVDYLKRDITEKENLISILNSQMTDKEQRVSTLETNKVIKDFGTINFQAAANQKIKITIPITSSAIYVSKLIVRIQPNYNSANYQGCLEKTFSFVSTPSNIFGGGSAEYTYIGNNADVFAISDAVLANGNIEIAVAFNSNKATTAKLMMEAYYSSNGTKTCIENATVGQIYTTDTTILPTPTYGFNKAIEVKEGIKSIDLHASYSRQSNVFILPYTNYAFFTPTADIDEYFKGLFAWICSNYSGVKNGIWIAPVGPTSQSAAIIHIYDTDNADANTGLPSYCSCIFLPPSTQSIYVIGTYNFVYRSNMIDLRFPITTTNSNGTAIQYQDGTMICTKQITLTGVAINTANGNGFISSDISLGNYAVQFNAAPALQVTPSRGTAHCFIYGVSSVGKNFIGNVCLGRFNATASSTINLDITATGRWKA